MCIPFHRNVYAPELNIGAAGGKLDLRQSGHFQIDPATALLIFDTFHSGQTPVQYIFFSVKTDKPSAG
jgi:hypothetical protein